MDIDKIIQAYLHQQSMLNASLLRDLAAMGFSEHISYSRLTPEENAASFGYSVVKITITEENV